jgi:peptidoglycan/xylan/chitin deacetylase (PgdA/CDA1 family)
MILAYHEIVPAESAYRYSVAAAQFEAHLRLLAELREKGETAKLLPQLTFDDGHASQHRYGLPLLEKYSCRAVFFVTAGWIGTRPAYMSWAQLKEMVARGQEVQSHAWSHKFLTHCARPELEEEVRRAKQTLEDGLGIAVEALAAPGGRWDDRVLEACAAAGYKRVYVSEPWLGPEQRKGVELAGRWMVERNMDTGRLRSLLDLAGGSLLLARARHRLKRTVRTALGDRMYHRLWSRLAAQGEREAIDKAYTSRSL